MDDGFSAEKNGARELFFFYFAKNVASEEAIFFQRKKRNIDVLLR